MTDTYTPTEQQLRQEVEALRRDAARYRWLRSKGAARGVIDWNALEWPFHDYEAMDAAIDAELAKSK